MELGGGPFTRGVNDPFMSERRIDLYRVYS